MNVPYSPKEGVGSFSNIYLWQLLVEVIYRNSIIPLTSVSTWKPFKRIFLKLNKLHWDCGEYKATLIRNSFPIGSKIEVLPEPFINFVVPKIIVTCPAQ